jgi:4-alpha-glucanotransferase
LGNIGLGGFFDPPDEREWEGRGRRFLEVMLENSSMLPCAEDLGVIPECSHRVLREFGIPGMDVQRWSRDWESTYAFKSPDSYRPNSVAVLSTHDMTPLLTWWQFEAGTIDEALFQKMCETRGISFEAVRDKLFDLERSVGGRLRWKDDVDSEEEFLRRLNLRREEARDFIDLHQGTFDERQKFWNYLGLPGEFKEKATQPFVRRALEKVSRSSSIFNIQFIQDWLALLSPLRSLPDCRDLRINVPGTRNERNWTFVLPLSLEEMKKLKINKELKAMNATAGRK